MKNEELNKILLAEVEKGTFPGATYALVSEFGTFYGALGFKSLYPTKETNSLDTLYDDSYIWSSCWIRRSNKN